MKLTLFAFLLFTTLVAAQTYIPVRGPCGRVIGYQIVNTPSATLLPKVNVAEFRSFPKVSETVASVPEPGRSAPTSWRVCPLDFDTIYLYKDERQEGKYRYPEKVYFKLMENGEWKLSELPSWAPPIPTQTNKNKGEWKPSSDKDWIFLYIGGTYDGAYHYPTKKYQQLNPRSGKYKEADIPPCAPKIPVNSEKLSYMI